MLPNLFIWISPWDEWTSSHLLPHKNLLPNTFKTIPVINIVQSIWLFVRKCKLIATKREKILDKTHINHSEPHQLCTILRNSSYSAIVLQAISLHCFLLFCLHFYCLIKMSWQIVEMNKTMQILTDNARN